MFVVHLVIITLSGMNPLTYIKNASKALILAFTSRSSLGTLPVTLEVLTENMDVDSGTASFVTSLGSNMGMNGCAGIYPALVSVMLANMAGVEMNFTVYVMLIIVIGKIVQHDKIKLEYELINERINTNHKRYEGINEIHNKLRYVYHDLKNHMTCIKNYNTKEEIVSYINKLELQISDFEKLRNTGNATLDIILGEKTHLCKKYNIEFEDYINISKLNFIQENDLCSIFANALDNAIEACTKIDNELEKRIVVRATYINGFAIIKFTNTKVNDIKFTGEKIETSKNNKKIHGIGISSIKYIVSKYKGEVLVNYSKNEFILKIMIPITKEEIITNEKNSIKVT